jgi:dTDP-glucose pyrophosphorylase
MIEKFQDQDIFALCGMFRQPDRHKISRTYAVFQDENQHISRLIEKPRNPMNDWMGTGNCLFRNQIMEYIDRTPINQERGEKELPDLIQCAIDEGRRVEPFDICANYANINYPEDLDELKDWNLT